MTPPRAAWHWLAAVVGAGALGLILVVLAGPPVVGSDQGVFLSVAARMLDGDALFADVVDNKDPLFFYSYAAALWVGGWRGPFLLDALWFALAAIGLAGMLRALGASRVTVATGFFVYPLALASGWYFTGLSMLGALALIPWSAWLWLRERYVAAGVVIGAVMLLKLNLGLVAIAPLVALLVFGRGTVSGRRAASLAIAGLGGTLIVAALLLAAQGSLGPYLETISYNAHYANALIDSTSAVTRTRAHVAVVTHYFTDAGLWQAPVAVGVVAAFAALVATALLRGSGPLRVLGLLGATTLGAALVTLALTAYWTHHLQLLALPAALIAASFVAAASTWASARWGVGVASVCVLFALWTALVDDWPPGVSGWSATPISAGADELEDARLRYYPGVDPVDYVVFGSNSENGHAAFIDDAFDLACRWFVLYPFSTQEQLSETIACFDRAQPKLVMISLFFFDDRPEAPWRTFVAAARERLESRYVLVGERDPGFQVWKRRTSAE